MKYLRLVLDAVRNIWNVTTPAALSSGARDSTRSLETERRQALEKYEKNRELAFDLERKLGIVVRWTRGSVEWEHAKNLVANRKYQRALDHLEGLIVARMFELTKMNMSQTGAYSTTDLKGLCLYSILQVTRCANTSVRHFKAAQVRFAPLSTTTTRLRVQ